MKKKKKKKTDFLDSDLTEEMAAEIAFNRLPKSHKTAIILKYGSAARWYRAAKIAQAREILDDLSKGIEKIESEL